MEKLLTISVAAYNVEKYLSSTLDSLSDNRYIDKLEVFVVDDGGKDRSLEIAKAFEKRFPQTFHAVHKENGGYGTTVNYSIEHATGKYFKLLDGDDFYDKDGLIRLINALKECDADIVFTQYNYYIKNEFKSAIHYNDNITEMVLPIEDFRFNAGTPMHALTYKTQVLRDSGMRLKEHILYTDNTYAAVPAKGAHTMIFLNIPVYNYRLGVEGQSVGRAGIVKHIDESKVISLDLVDFYRNNITSSDTCKKYILVNIASTCVNYVVGLLKMPVGKEAFNRLIEFDNIVRFKSIDIFNKMIDIDRKASKSLKLIRNSNYLLYWLFAFIYRFID